VLTMVGVASIAVVLEPWRQPLQVDASIYAMVGRDWLGGMVPYRDIYVAKPPIWILFSGLAAAFGDWSGVGMATGVRLLSTMAAASIGLATYFLLEARRVRPGVGFVTALVATAVFSAPAFSDGGGLSEPFAFSIGLAAWLLAERAEGPVASAAVGGLSVLAIGSSLLSVPLVVAAGLAAVSKGEVRRVMRLLAFAAGLTVVSVGIVGYFVIVHAFGDLWHQVVDFSRAYALVQCPLASAGAWPCPNVAPLVRYGYLVIMAGILAPSLGLLLLRRAQDVPWRAFVAAALALALTISSIQRSPTTHYYLPLIVTALPLAAIGTEQMARAFQRRAIRASAALLTVLVAVSTVVAVQVNAIAWRAGSNAGLSQDVLSLASSLEHQDPSRPLFIWGRSAPMLVVTGRRHAARFVDTFSLELPGFTGESTVRQACEVMASERPLILADASGPPLTPNAAVAAGLDPSWFAPLRRVVAENWVLVGGSGEAALYAPKTSAPLPTTVCEVDGS